MTENKVLEIVKSDVWEAVILSGVLGSSKNQVALFKFLLDHKFNTPEGELKTKNIAISVFDKDDNFSAKKDSIVRVEMFRLRANLTTFNQQSSSLKISLPKSSYQLHLEKLAQSDAANLPVDGESTRFEGRNKKTVYAVSAAVVAGVFVVMSTGAFNAEPKGVDCSEIIPNLEIVPSREISDLNAYVHHVISGAASQFSHFNIVQDVKSCTSSNVPGYKLEYALLRTDADFQGSLSVISQQNAKIIGVDNFSGVSMGDVSDPNLGREDLYFTIAKITNDLLKPNRVVHRDTVNQTWKNPTVFEDYRCLIKMHESFVSDSNTDYYEGLKCLETTYKNGTASLDNLGGLAASYLEQAQGNRTINGVDPLVQATVILDDIGERWPQSSEATAAKIMYETVRDDYNEQRLRETLLRAEKTYTSHPAVLAEVSRYYGFMLGEWDSAIRVMDRVKRLTSDEDNSIYQVDAAYAVLGKAGSSGWSNCVKAYSEHSKVSNLLVHACAVKYKKPIWETRTANNLAKFDLLQLDKKVDFLEKMGFESSVTDALILRLEDNFYD